MRPLKIATAGITLCMGVVGGQPNQMQAIVDQKFQPLTAETPQTQFLGTVEAQVTKDNLEVKIEVTRSNCFLKENNVYDIPTQTFSPQDNQKSFEYLLSLERSLQFTCLYEGDTAAVAGRATVVCNEDQVDVGGVISKTRRAEQDAFVFEAYYEIGVSCLDTTVLPSSKVATISTSTTTTETPVTSTLDSTSTVASVETQALLVTGQCSTRWYQAWAKADDTPECNGDTFPNCAICMKDIDKHFKNGWTNGKYNFGTPFEAEMDIIISASCMDSGVGVSNTGKVRVSSDGKMLTLIGEMHEGYLSSTVTLHFGPDELPERVQVRGEVIPRGVLVEQFTTEDSGTRYWKFQTKIPTKKQGPGYIGIHTTVCSSQ